MTPTFAPDDTIRLSDLAGHLRDSVTEPDLTPGYRWLYAAVQDGRFPAPTRGPTQRERWVKRVDVPAIARMFGLTLRAITPPATPPNPPSTRRDLHRGG
jgi:hypothetical protein